MSQTTSGSGPAEQPKKRPSDATSTLAFVFVVGGVLCLLAAPVILFSGESDLNSLRQRNAASHMGRTASESKGGNATLTITNAIETLKEDLLAEAQKERIYDNAFGSARNGVGLIGLGMLLRAAADVRRRVVA